MINDTLKEMLSLMEKAKIACEVVDVENRKLQSIADADNERRFRKMCDCLKELYQTFYDIGWDSLVIKTSYPAASYYHKNIALKFARSHRGIEVYAYDSTLRYDDGHYCFSIATNYSFTDACKHFVNFSFAEGVFTILMDNWDEAWNEIQNEFAKQIQKKINQNITACMDKHEKLKKKIAEFKL